MKAAVLGDAGVEVRDLDKPAPKPNEVLIRVRASTLNRADLIVASGQRHGAVGGAGARIGLECAGEIEAVGSDVTGIKPGDRVMATAPGGIAQYAVTDASRVHRIPANNMTFEQAACFPVALGTMHNAVVTAGRLKRGETLLMQGASAGVGLMGMQIAKLMGASLVMGASTNPERRARLKEFGCDLAIDSAQPGWPDEVKQATGGKGVDVIIDLVSAPVANQNLAAAAILGRIVNVGRLGGMKGRVRLRPACGQADRLHRRHLPHPHAGGGSRDQPADARRPVGRRRGRHASPADSQDVSARGSCGCARHDEGQPAFREDRHRDVGRTPKPGWRFVAQMERKRNPGTAVE